MSDLKASIKKLRESISEIEKKGIDISRKTDISKTFHDFKEKKDSYYRSSFEGSLNEVKKAAFEIANISPGKDYSLELLLLTKEFESSRTDMKKLRAILEKMDSLSSKIPSSLSSSKKLSRRQDSELSIIVPAKMPGEIRSDIAADISEIEKCFNCGLYRSATILCGRVLETALHRKYYDATGNDILEKSPGIGLGNLIAKLKEKNVELDPALTQQVHLINNVRIFSVHKKQEAFMPSKEQSHAIILYTMDILKRMW